MNLSKRWHLTLIFPIMAILSCGVSRKVPSTMVEINLPPLQESVIYIPLKVYIKSYIDQAEAKTPRQFISNGWPDFLASSCDFRYKYRFIRSGLRFACVNNNAVITMAGNYQLAGSKTVCAFGKQVSPWITGSCGFSPEAMRRVEISIRSSLQFKPDYTLRASSAVDRIRPLDKCVVTLLQSDVTEMVIDSIRSSVNAFASSLDQIIAAININALVKKVGAAVGKKIVLSNYGYIKINPSAISIGPINVQQDTLQLVARFSCFPELTSDSNNSVRTSFLPPLSVTSGGPGFSLHANAAYDYRFIDTLLNRMVVNRPFHLEGNTFNIEKISVRGLDDNRVELGFAFSGTKKGKIYFTGTPVLDVKTQVISIPDLDYSLRSKDLVLNLGKTFFNRSILSKIRAKAVINIDEIYKQNKSGLDSAFNRKIAPGIYSKGSSKDFKLTGLVVKKDNLLFQVHASGALNLNINPK